MKIHENAGTKRNVHLRKIKIINYGWTLMMILVLVTGASFSAKVQADGPSMTFTTNQSSRIVEKGQIAWTFEYTDIFDPTIHYFKELSPPIQCQAVMDVDLDGRDDILIGGHSPSIGSFIIAVNGYSASLLWIDNGEDFVACPLHLNRLLSPSNAENDAVSPYLVIITTTPLEDGRDSIGLRYLNGASGRVMWQDVNLFTVERSLYHGSIGDFLISPVMINQRALVRMAFFMIGVPESEVVAVNLDSKQVAWRVKLPLGVNLIRMAATEITNDSFPEIILTGAGNGNVTILDGTTGIMLRTHSIHLWDPPNSMLAGKDLTDDGIVDYIISAGGVGGVEAFDGATGIPLWHLGAFNASARMTASMVHPRIAWYSDALVNTRTPLLVIGYANATGGMPVVTLVNASSGSIIRKMFFDIPTKEEVANIEGIKIGDIDDNGNNDIILTMGNEEWVYLINGTTWMVEWGIPLVDLLDNPMKLIVTGLGEFTGDDILEVVVNGHNRTVAISAGMFTTTLAPRIIIDIDPNDTLSRFTSPLHHAAADGILSFLTSGFDMNTWMVVRLFVALVLHRVRKSNRESK